ncbi:MAG: hypothetical protein GAK28_01401 [Luteibacter sp.]|uniref:hypothetical protein n=1 Tax=Luteibacter sp. TaxID=1886636 RepID=UPI0013808B9D|nr:hypothetical protein [Luteibacter sp.]KAF1007925.1 MAG: hypothetical protein GAK28_01401 [Luteibacter sp.]
MSFTEIAVIAIALTIGYKYTSALISPSAKKDAAGKPARSDTTPAPLGLEHDADPSHEAAMGLLDDFLSGDSHRIWAASWGVRTLRDPVQLNLLVGQLDRIRAATLKVNMGGVVVSNNVHLECALRKLEHVRHRAGCLCALYESDIFYNPTKEAEAGNLVIDETGTQAGGWGDVHHCHCPTCGSAWRVEDREYHYPWWEWRRAEA